tara:strand:+ start:1304 stop:1783 length:480 start_codon:yes stop_codon:yes gene_type:complete
MMDYIEVTKTRLTSNFEHEKRGYERSIEKVNTRTEEILKLPIYDDKQVDIRITQHAYQRTTSVEYIVFSLTPEEIDALQIEQITSEDIRSAVQRVLNIPAVRHLDYWGDLFYKFQTDTLVVMISGAKLAEGCQLVTKKSQQTFTSYSIDCPKGINPNDD